MAECCAPFRIKGIVSKSASVFLACVLALGVGACGSSEGAESASGGVDAGSSGGTSGGSGGASGTGASAGAAGGGGVAAGAGTGGAPTGGSGGASGGSAGAGGSGASGTCVPFGFPCGVPGHADTCCEGTCNKQYNSCCSVEGGKCQTTGFLFNDGCCPGRFCDAATNKCVTATCYPSVGPASNTGQCDIPGFPKLNCCDPEFVCDDDPIEGKRCCAPDGAFVLKEETYECCSGSWEVLGANAKCIP